MEAYSNNHESRLPRIPYINIHTHTDPGHETVYVKNLFPGEAVAAFSGRNFYSMGLHPWYLKSEAENNELLQMMEEALEIEHVCLVGECGLDKVAKTNFDEQQRVFRAQAFMAEEFKLPLIIHCVRSYNEVMELHDSMHPENPWILHGYNGSVQQTEQFAQRRFYFSFGKILLQSGAKAIESFKRLPFEKIFLETDEYSGDIEELYMQGAKIKGISPDMLKKSVWNNFSQIENSRLSRF